MLGDSFNIYRAYNSMALCGGSVWYIKEQVNASGGYIGVSLDKLRVAKIKLRDKNST